MQIIFVEDRKPQPKWINNNTIMTGKKVIHIEAIAATFRLYAPL